MGTHKLTGASYEPPPVGCINHACVCWFVGRRCVSITGMSYAVALTLGDEVLNLVSALVSSHRDRGGLNSARRCDACHVMPCTGRGDSSRNAFPASGVGRAGQPLRARLVVAVVMMRMAMCAWSWMGWVGIGPGGHSDQPTSLPGPRFNLLFVPI